MKGVLIRILLEILETMGTTVTPEIRELIRVALKDLYQRAEQTSNPFDNVAVMILAAIAGFSKEDLER